MSGIGHWGYAIGVVWSCDCGDDTVRRTKCPRCADEYAAHNTGPSVRVRIRVEKLGGKYLRTE